MAPYIQTVTGPLPADELGFILPHEHTGVDLWHVANRWDYWELIRDEDVIAEELGRFQALGGTCLVDVTNHGLGRDPERLRRLSERTGLPIVMGSGWYRGPYYPPEALGIPTQALVRDIHQAGATQRLEPAQLLGDHVLVADQLPVVPAVRHVPQIDAGVLMGQYEAELIGRDRPGDGLDVGAHRSPSCAPAGSR